MELLVWDLISISILIVPIYAIKEFFYLRKKFLLGLICCLYTEKVSKIVTKGMFPSLLKRPDNAINCNLFNLGGKVGKNSGFPSGHVTIASYFSNYLFFIHNDKLVDNNKMVFYNLYPILIGLSRYHKNCHNLFQIVSGHILGFIVAYLITK